MVNGDQPMLFVPENSSQDVSMMQEQNAQK